MNLRRWRNLLATGLLALLAFPMAANSFSISATHFQGAVAYKPGGGAGAILGLANPQISALLGSTAMSYNAAALVSFNFSIAPTYPSPFDLQSAPDKQWKWSLHAHDFKLPSILGGAPLPEVSVSKQASYNQVMAGAMWAQTQVSQALGGQFGWGWAIHWTTATTGIGYLAVAANLNPAWLPGGGQLPFYSAFDAGKGTIDASVEAVPEPLTMVLFGSGLAGMGIARFRRRKSEVN
jgi:hypothetical protein